MKERLIVYIVVAVFVIGGIVWYFKSTTPGPVLSGGAVQGALIPDYWTKEEAQTRGNEALLFSDGLKVELFKNDYGRFPQTIQEMIANNISINKDIFSQQLPQYSLHTDQKDFDLAFTGPDGKFGTVDDVKYDRTRFADSKLAMYGGEDRVKIASMLEADRNFIDTQVAKYGSKEKALPAVLANAKDLLSRGDLDGAMRTYNQAWLLDMKSADVYLGFAAVLESQGKAADAAKMRAMAAGA